MLLKKTIPLIALLAMFIFANAQHKSPDTDVNTESQSLKILSWNIKMLPHFILPEKKLKRAKLIGEVLADSDYDIIVFQEAFHSVSRKHIYKRLKHKFPFVYGPANKKWYSLKTNSGVWIVSKIPLHEVVEIKYSNCKNADCYSRKGAIMVKGSWDEHEFYLIGTHIQAGGPDTLKESQFIEIKTNLIDPFCDTSIPFVICGDMNTKQGSSLYDSMLTTLSSIDCMANLKNTFTSDGINNDMSGGSSQKIIDYFLLNDKTKSIKEIRCDVIKYQQKWSKNNKDLSDHYAVSAEIVFD